jgi:hypothetical protein
MISDAILRDARQMVELDMAVMLEKSYKYPGEPCIMQTGLCYGSCEHAATAGAYIACLKCLYSLGFQNGYNFRMQLERM